MNERVFQEKHYFWNKLFKLWLNEGVLKRINKYLIKWIPFPINRFLIKWPLLPFVERTFNLINFQFNQLSNQWLFNSIDESITTNNMLRIIESFQLNRRVHYEEKGCDHRRIILDILKNKLYEISLLIKNLWKLYMTR
jgi:hypothetical protein